MPFDLHTYLANSAPWQDRGPDVVVPAAAGRPQVVVTARFRDGYTGRARGIAYAWTSKAVEVRFHHPDEVVLNAPRIGGSGYKVWLPIADVTTDLSTLPAPPRLHLWPGDVARWGPTGRPPVVGAALDDRDEDDELKW
ncbi:hypothetical protein [Kineococcus sp. SYSU DK003]|uniref:hypothetical protein n=1 Tax=Kineococcus sp. SYSU DK003 TaxID=3383124 RepID=UPI003D7CD381